jgi:hypothetical protein
VPVVESRVVVDVDPETAFAVSQTTGATRLRWDPFIRAQRLLDGATAPGKGVRTWTRHRLGLAMVSEYVSYAPPRNVGMRMVGRVWPFEHFAGGWQFRPVAGQPDRADVTWRYSFATRPAWLAPLADRVGTVVLGREVRRRLEAFARGCADPVVLAAVRGDPPGDGVDSSPGSDTA